MRRRESILDQSWGLVNELISEEKRHGVFSLSSFHTFIHPTSLSRNRGKSGVWKVNTFVALQMVLPCLCHVNQCPYVNKRNNCYLDLWPTPHVFGKWWSNFWVIQSIDSYLLTSVHEPVVLNDWLTNEHSSVNFFPFPFSFVPTPGVFNIHTLSEKLFCAFCAILLVSNRLQMGSAH